MRPSQCRKQQINSQTSELEALEARIREMEKRLKLQGNSNTPGNNSGTQDHATSSHDLAFRPAPPEKDYPAGQNLDREQQQQQQQQQKYGGSRPGTARQSQQAVPGALPPTPVGSEGECDPPVARPLRSPPRPSGTQAQPYPGRSSASFGRTSPSTMRRKPIPSRDSDSTTSASESSTVADYVLVPEPDGDRDRHV